MQTLTIASEDTTLTWRRAKSLADEVADDLIGESTCLSWYDKERDREAPAHASECHDTCEIPGYVEYAETRGAELQVVFGEGDFVFCYRSLGEFADLPGYRKD